MTGGKAWEPWVLQVRGCCRSMRHPDSGDRTDSQLSKLRPQDPGLSGAEGGFLPAAARLRVPFSEALGSQPLQVRGGAECPRPWFPFCRVLSTRLPLARCCPALQSAWACTAVCACHRPSTGRGRGDEPHPAAGVTARSCCCRRPSATTLGGTQGPVWLPLCAKTGAAHEELGSRAPRVSALSSSCTLGGGLQTARQLCEHSRTKADSCLFLTLVLAASLPPSGRGALLRPHPALDVTTLTPHCSPSHPPSPEPIAACSSPCSPAPPPSSSCP